MSSVTADPRYPVVREIVFKIANVKSYNTNYVQQLESRLKASLEQHPEILRICQEPGSLSVFAAMAADRVDTVYDFWEVMNLLDTLYRMDTEGKINAED